MTRVYGVSELADGAAPEYAHGLREAVSAAVDYALTAIEAGEDRPLAIPAALLAQARLAARHGVGLDIVLRRYLSGFMLLNDFALQEADAAHRGSSAHGVLRTLSVQFDRVVTAVVDEYNREAEMRQLLGPERRVERVKRLLAGELLDTADLRYEFDAWHVGVVVEADAGASLLAALAKSLDRRLLCVSPQPHTVWAWLGGQRKVRSDEVAGRIEELQNGNLRVSIGEAGRGLTGWRLTHRQARAAVAVAFEREHSVVRYADVGVLASIVNDDLLVSSLTQIYLVPLREGRGNGRSSRDTLRAYFSSGWNITATAAALGVSRQTVRSRLCAVEEKLGPLENCGAELALALRLDGERRVVPA
jgi:hypothetical protein